ncbi:hypothetical protein GCM10025880_28280 [Methylorubrum aminovorans]|uniref:hypothetical protein n=1 Tax=Methylorubrum aminovorans TaxID=269069 RepID=UPI0023E959BF|nr:hypothetical protein [Methylorubrum aminovorans]GMA76411.1 hypothetical protein GCM10025880_28280 [Methylorubrum aminovorans]
MSETVQAGKNGAKVPTGTISPEELLKQAVAGAKAGPATAPAALLARKSFRLGAHGRLAAASAVALIGGLSSAFSPHRKGRPTRGSRRSGASWPRDA